MLTVPTTSVGTSRASGPSIDPTAESAARQQLCDRDDDASLNAVAQELDTFDAGVDVAPLSEALRTLENNTHLASLGPDALALRDSAIQAIRVVESEVTDVAAREQAANALRQMLLELETQICPPPEI